MATQRPLLLLTRPRPASETFWQALPPNARDSVDCLINPLLSIHATGVLPPLKHASGLIFTSANALDAYAALGGQVLDIPVIAVGEATGQATRRFGFRTDVAGGNADDLVRHVIEGGYEGPLVHLRGENAIGHVAERLTKAGVPTSEAVLYQQQLEVFSAATREALSQDRFVLAPVFSPRTARQLGRESQGLGTIRFAALSDAVAAALPKECAGRIRVSRRPDREGMVALVTEMIAEAVGLERQNRQL